MLAQKAGVGIHFIRDLEQGKETVCMDKVNQVLQLFQFKMYPARIRGELPFRPRVASTLKYKDIDDPEWWPGAT